MANRKPKIEYQSQPRFMLEPYSGLRSRDTCPSCGHKHKFSHFIDVTTGERIGTDFGRCERVEHCGYLKSPTGDDLKGLSLEVSTSEVKNKFRKKDYTSLINPKYVNKSMGEFQDNFTRFLLSKFDNNIVNQILRRYKVGCIPMWDSFATIYWQIDKDFDVRTGKVMLYDVETGKRVKEPRSYVSWVHSPMKNNDFGENSDFCLTQCFFGEHLLNEEGIDTFHVVESEKTAILCSIVKPSSYWIATGGIQNINEERLRPFIGKKLKFYPDKGKGYEEWCMKLKKFKSLINIEVIDSLEKDNRLKEGDDLGDLILLKK